MSKERKVVNRNNFDSFRFSAKFIRNFVARIEYFFAPLVILYFIDSVVDRGRMARENRFDTLPWIRVGRVSVFSRFPSFSDLLYFYFFSFFFRF